MTSVFSTTEEERGEQQNTTHRHLPFATANTLRISSYSACITGSECYDQIAPDSVTSPLSADMRGALVMGRACLRNTSSRPQLSRHFHHTFRTSSRQQSIIPYIRESFGRRPPHLEKGTVLLAALSPVAFVSIADDEEKHRDGKTGEEHMLEASQIGRAHV